MYRRKAAALPQHSTFPTDLEKLGYCINGDDQIKKIEYPDEDFQFYLTRSESLNQIHAEAMHTCIKREVVKRMTDLGIPVLYLPQLSTTLPKQPSLPILATPAAQLRQRKHIIVIINRQDQDLGIWSYRDLSHAFGISGGSTVSFAQECISRFRSVESKKSVPSPGFVVFNTAQLLYSHKHAMAMTTRTWISLPRKSAVHPPPRVDPVHNRIPGNESPEAHIKFVFDQVLANPDFVSSDAELYVVACADGAEEVLKYLTANWPLRHARLSALALVSPSMVSSHTVSACRSHSKLRSFLAHRARAWSVSNQPLNTPLRSPIMPSSEQSAADGAAADVAKLPLDTDEQKFSLFPELSSGVDTFPECVMAAAYRAVVDWFKNVVEEGQGYKNPVFEVAEDKTESEADAGW